MLFQKKSRKLCIKNYLSFAMMRSYSKNLQILAATLALFSAQRLVWQKQIQRLLLLFISRPIHQMVLVLFRPALKHTMKQTLSACMQLFLTPERQCR